LLFDFDFYFDFDFDFDFDFNLLILTCRRKAAKIFFGNCPCR